MIPKNKSININKNGKTINKKDALLIFINTINSILIASIFLLYYLTMPVITSKVLFIPKGSTKFIVTHLSKNYYEVNKIDEIILDNFGFVQSGWIDLKVNKLTKMDFLLKLLKSKAALKSITLIPGDTAHFFLKKLALEFSLDENKLNDVYNKYAFKLDGNILAETYSLPIGMSEEHLLFYLFSQTNKKYEEYSNKIFGFYDKEQWYKYVTLASVIQKEAATIDEMPIVSSVIYNRLKKKMPLQMDGTLNYGEHSNTKITAMRIKEDNSSYNTYKNRGIPKNPVCAVSLDAIKAAIFPVKSDYLYFVRDNNNGLHKFSSSYIEHKGNINSNIGVIKNYSKINDNPSKIDDEAKNIMKNDISKQTVPSIKDLFNNIN
ncbi:putative aminodeoxychorismate lyase [Arcobacter porcinus]|uniref:Endolytic murein transglycosylase n=1 Tax=Arcobacter porcinus TaxID=1935204 RepID=A0ABX2YD12_9BACT|nr:putative aminodeoxychorismate lyase [Arcobacter porcinus]OCL85674.1 putative aminodeoxychorismate lyase [Arcobacter porcinus]OCL92872.1 putative aminodeoxychorismate lyase [Arcobacter porcinus]